MAREHERLTAAVRGLATSPDRLQIRLERAGLALAPLRADEFADRSQGAAFAAIMEALTEVDGSAAEGSIAATAHDLDDQRAARIADQIVTLQARQTSDR